MVSSAVTAARHAAGSTLEQVTPRRRFVADYVWYGLDPRDRNRPQRPLPPGFELRQAGCADLDLLERIPHDPAVTTITRTLARERLADGAQAWLAVQGDRVAFSCWTFRGRGPVHGARGGAMTVPAGVVQVDDCVAAPDVRGLGLGPATWSAIAGTTAPEECLVTKVDVTNGSSRRAVEKAGFREIARMRIVWRDWRTWIRVAPGDPRAAWLTSLDRG